MMATRALVRGLVALLPAVVVAVAGAGVAVVAILTVLAVLVVVLQVVPELLAAPDPTAPGVRRRSRFATAARPRVAEPVRAPADLRRMETLVAARVQSALGVDNWLRPLVADIATTRLGQHGADWSRAGAHSIPDPLWALIRPDRPQPVERDGPGISFAELELIVDQLEAL